MGKIVRYKPRRNRRQRKRKAPRVPLIPFALLGAAAVGYYGPGVVPSGFLSAKATASNPSTLVGRASVIDGDTIEIHGERIRFNGIDAPESAQTCEDGNGNPYRCGARVADAVDQFLKASSPTRCEFVERDRYGRFVGNCFRADGTSVQAALVRNGWAMDWPRYSDGAYASEQAAARSERIGIWAGTVQPPWEWRADQRQVRQPDVAPLIGTSTSGSCRIKGNIASDGERIYHVPGQEYYAKTRISKGKGERWFCSEADARAAGWRAAQR
jgi:endonuclease YncB( thermonuclease family)